MTPRRQLDDLTSRLLRDALADTRELLRAEMRPLAQHLERHDEQLGQIDEKLDAICKRLDARPAKHWLAGRVTQLVDRLVPLGLVALITYLLTHMQGG